MQSYMYSNDLTEEEKNAGFQVVEVINPTGHYFGHPNTIPAVVRIICDDQRLIKTSSNGVVTYIHQVRVPNSRKEKWSSCKTSAYSIEEAKTRLPASEEELSKILGWRSKL